MHAHSFSLACLLKLGDIVQDGQSAVQQFLLSSEESWLALWDICGMSVPPVDGSEPVNNQLKDSPALVAAVASQVLNFPVASYIFSTDSTIVDSNLPPPASAV